MPVYNGIVEFVGLQEARSGETQFKRSKHVEGRKGLRTAARRKQTYVKTNWQSLVLIYNRRPQKSSTLLNFAVHADQKFDG
jgi:hypothetical protein